MDTIDPLTSAESPFAPDAIRVWGSPQDLWWNRRGKLSPVQRLQARKAGVVLPWIAMVLGVIFVGGTWAAFRDDPNATRIMIGLSLLAGFPVWVLWRQGHRGAAAGRANVAERAIGTVERRAKGHPRYRAAEIRIGDVGLPLLGMWAAKFAAGNVYEIHYSEKDKNLLSAVAYPAPPGDLHAAYLDLERAFTPGDEFSLSPRCSHCDPSPDAAETITDPCRFHTRADLAVVGGDLISHWGTSADLKLLLPRLLLYSATGLVGSLDVESLGAKLAAAGFENWTDDERGAVELYWLLLWRRVCRDEHGPVSAPELLTAVAIAQIPMVSFLDDLTVDAGALGALTRLIIEELDFDTHGLRRPHWPSDRSAELRRWLASPATPRPPRRARRSPGVGPRRSHGARPSPVVIVPLVNPRHQ